MNVSCPECRSSFRVDPSKVPATGIRARCSVCGGIIAITGGTMTGVVTPPLTAAAHGAGVTAHAASAPQGQGPAQRVAASASTPAPAPFTPPRSATPELSATGTATPRRPINPFLNAAPGQRARRLARALVSDLVAYHPDRRDEGIRNGTLRQLFREEIKKSYEEYVEQVGRELAESTTHFQEALNELLAGGRKMF